MHIRPITDADLPAVLEVYRQCEDFLALGPNPQASLEMIAADRDITRVQSGEFCGLFAPDGSLIGIFDFVRSGFNGDPACAFIELLMIAAPYRSQGTGARAVAWLEADLRRAGAARLEAAVQANNPLGIHFWEGMGFNIVGLAESQLDGTVTILIKKETSA